MEVHYELELDVPREYAFERFTDIQEISSTLPANIVLRPEKGAYELSEGSVWIVKAQRSGRKFVVRNRVINNTYPEKIVFESESNRVESFVEVKFEKLGPESCIVKSVFDMVPKGLLGRILLQSLKSSQKRIFNAMDSGAERLRNSIETDYKQTRDP